MEKKLDIKALESRAKETNADNRNGVKLAVFGSRTLFGDDVAAEIIECIREQNASIIVTTQEPRGVCTVAQNVAKRIALPLELHFLNCAKYARGMHHHRSREVVESSDFFLVIHDGVSQGTKNELELIKKSGKPYKYVVLTPDEYAHRNDQKLETISDFTDEGATKAAKKLL